MPPENSDPWLEGVFLSLAVASIGTWIALWNRRAGGPFLPYEPRRPVPWSGIWTLLPILFVALVVIGAPYPNEPAAKPSATEVTDGVERLGSGALQELAFVVSFLAVVILTSGASRADMGLPKDRYELVRDIRIGFVAWLAALAPVYGVQIALIGIFGPSQGHPLIQLLEEQSNPSLFIAALVVAVGIAPVCEELMFRVLLQGWFEKAEDLKLGWRTPIETVTVEPALMEISPVESTSVESAPTDAIESPIENALPPAEPPQVSLARLPYGWLPIVSSSVLFALAHFGYGPEPVPLFVLALVLGYVYQRTHRVVPSIVAHALFNGMSLFALWRLISAGTE